MTINPTISEWLNLIVRWIHVFAGIMWVGTTYYFTWLDARLSEEEKAVANTGETAQIWMSTAPPGHPQPPSGHGPLARTPVRLDDPLGHQRHGLLQAAT